MSEKKIDLRRWFFPYFRKHKRVVILDLFCASLTTLNEIVLPMLVMAGLSGYSFAVCSSICENNLVSNFIFLPPVMFGFMFLYLNN